MRFFHLGAFPRLATISAFRTATTALAMAQEHDGHVEILTYALWPVSPKVRQIEPWMRAAAALSGHHDADGPRSASPTFACDQPAEVCRHSVRQSECRGAQISGAKGEEADECSENCNNNRVLPGANGRGTFTSRKGG